MNEHERIVKCWTRAAWMVASVSVVCLLGHAVTVHYGATPAVRLTEAAHAYENAERSRAETAYAEFRRAEIERAKYEEGKAACEALHHP